MKTRTKKEQAACELAASVVQRERDEKLRLEVIEAKKLVGRCFKYRNSYGCGDKKGPWWLYKKVLEAEEDGGIRSLSFEWDNAGCLTLKPNEWSMGFHSGYSEISLVEFNKALIETKVKVASINP